MWELLKMIIFGGTTVLTTQPIDIGNEWMSIKPEKPLTAINPGARLEIDVSGIVPNSIPPVTRLERSGEWFPKGCAQARLQGPRQSVELRSATVSASNEQTFLDLVPTDAMPTDVDFTEVLLRADCEISGTTVLWRNYSE